MVGGAVDYGISFGFHWVGIVVEIELATKNSGGVAELFGRYCLRGLQWECSFVGGRRVDDGVVVLGVMGNLGAC